MTAPTRNPLPAVLFDLDGTLIDTIELILSSARHAFEGWPRATPTDDEWVRGIGTPLVTQLRPFAETEEEVALLLDRYRAYQHVHHDSLTRCYDHVPAEVARLSGRGHPLAVVTSKASAIANRSLAHVGLDRFFDAVIGYDDTERHKPHPEPILAGLGRLGVSSSRAVYVGDSPFDIRAAKAAGIHAVAVTWGGIHPRERLEAEQPHEVVDSAEELLAAL